MRERVVRLWKFARTPEGMKMIKFTMVSVISALTSLVVLAIVYGVFKLWTEVGCVLFANLTAGVPSYILNRRWVWGKSGRSHLVKEILPFAVISVTGIGFALFTASLAHHFADAHHLHHLVRTLLVEFVNIASFGILWVFKFLILNRLFAQIPDPELAAEAGTGAPGVTEA
jgi:putative flippase GtrA